MPLREQPTIVACGGVVATITFIVACKKFLTQRIHIKPRFLHKHDSRRSKTTVERLKEVLPPFAPQRLVIHPAMQTIMYGRVYNDVHASLIRRQQILSMNDGGTVALEWIHRAPHTDNHNNKHKDADPIVIILGGLTSRGESELALAEAALNKGFRPVIFLKRGHGVELTTPRLQGFGDTRDLRQCIDIISQTYPEAVLFSVGVSAGSGLLASYVGEHCTHGRDDAEQQQALNHLVSATVMISPGFDAEQLFAKARIPFPYGSVLTNNLRNHILKPNAHVLQQALNIDFAMQSDGVAEFDERVYAPLNGFSSLKEYWASNNPMRDLRDTTRVTTIPCLALCAMDDPVCSSTLIDSELFKNAPNAILMTTSKGGHCGWIEHLHPTHSWANTVAIEYFNLFLEEDTPTHTHTN